MSLVSSLRALLCAFMEILLVFGGFEDCVGAHKVGWCISDSILCNFTRTTLLLW